MTKRISITPSDRGLLCAESALVFGLTAFSGGAYVAGDIFKRFSKQFNGLGAYMDSWALDVLEMTADTLQKYVWKELEDD